MGYPEEVKHFNDFLGTLNFKHKIVIAGNHDLSFDKKNKDRLTQNFLITIMTEMLMNANKC
jgi:hypothetical protein